MQVPASPSASADQYRDIDPDLKYSFIDPDRDRAVVLRTK